MDFFNELGFRYFFRYRDMHEINGILRARCRCRVFSELMIDRINYNHYNFSYLGVFIIFFTLENQTEQYQKMQELMKYRTELNTVQKKIDRK